MSVDSPVSRPRPNIVFILSDDQGSWALGGNGNREMQTPHLNALARSGTSFSNFFCASPVCSPARATLFTGQIPSRHGIHDWIRSGNRLTPGEHSQGLGDYLLDLPAYPEVLAENGYVCGISGKWHLGNSGCPQRGFTFWDVHADGGGPYFNAPMYRGSDLRYESQYVTDAITDNAVSFLQKHASGGRPFYLSVHYTAPHSPWGREHHPTAVYDEFYKHCAFESVPDEELHPDHINTAEYPRNQESRRAILSGYFSAVSEMDRNIGRILEELVRLGVRDNTLVVFTSDNGMNMGHHGIYGKGNGTFPQNMYDSSIRVPAIFSWPRQIPAGVSNPQLVSQYDFVPTLFDLLDHPVSDGGDGEAPGRSFARMLLGGATDGRESVTVYDEYGDVRMIRTERWKYVRRYRFGSDQLFNVSDDPAEQRNLASSTEHRATMRELALIMEDWFERYADPRVDGRNRGVTGRGQLKPIRLSGDREAAFADDWKYASER